MEGKVTVRVSELLETAKGCMLREGVPEEEAEIIANSLVQADRRGVFSHGVVCLPRYAGLMRSGMMRTAESHEVTRRLGAVEVWDGKRSSGQVLGHRAMTRAMEMAKECGVGIVAVYHGNHFGAGAYYAMLAQAQGMIGIAASTGSPTMAPWGGMDKCLGNNPVAVAVPAREHGPVVLDMAPSVVALGKLILAQKLGKSIPEGWALDKDGRPTTDPAAGRAGSLVPIGGAKGSGLAIMVDVLCGILSGGPYGPHLHDLYVMDEPQGVSHFLGAIDIAHFIEPAAFKSALSAMSREIKALKKADGVEEIFLPGERSGRKAEENAANGIEVPQPVYEELLELGKPYGLSL